VGTDGDGRTASANDSESIPDTGDSPAEAHSRRQRRNLRTWKGVRS
jgi:hypothetical protein